MKMLLTAILIFLLLLIIYVYITSLIVLRKTNIRYPILLPVIGHLYKFFGNAEGFTKKLISLSKSYRESVAIFLGTQFVAFFYNPDDIASLPNSALQKKSKHYEFMKMALGDGILTNFGERHKQSKKVLLEAMSSINLKKYVKHFNEQSRSMVDEFKTKIGHDEFDIEHIIGFHLFKIVLGTVVGLDTNTVNDEKIVKYNDQMARYTECAFTRAFSIWLYPDFLFKMSSLYRDQRQICDSMHALTEFFIEERKRKFESLNETEKEQDKVFIDTFFTTKKDDGQDFSMKEMRDDVMTLFCAGVETSHVTLGVLILLLAIHPEIQQKVYDELNDKFGEKSDFSMDDVQDLPYMDQVFNETLRFFSPLPMVGREVTDDFTMPNKGLIPKGSNVVIMLFLLHRNPDIYPNPLAFNPENFSSENIEKRSPDAFIPFGVGSRKCIGAAYGKIAIKVMLAHLIRNFYFRTTRTMNDFRICAQITMKNKGGAIVSLHRRKTVLK